MEKNLHKIMTVSFIVGAFLAAYIVRVLMEVLAATWGPFAKVLDIVWVRHGAPVGVGFILFLYCIFTPKVRLWANEVIMEISKVVWPSRKDTSAMTIAVTFIILLSGVLLGIFDFATSEIMGWILKMDKLF